MHRIELLALLDRYHSPFMDEAAFIRKARDFILKHEDCFYRELLPAHVTGSSWVVSPDRDHVLLLHHRKLNQWFQPGGHADGDHDILRVALRETSEETSLAPEFIKLVDGGIFDVDIHSIPPTRHTGVLEPEHQHIDIRFLMEIDGDIPIPGNDESHQVLWVPLNKVSAYNNNRSTYRMVEKTRRLRRRQAK